jgi:FAD/FMN-containing dehydrogenase/Fe-S oxidoreductase
MDFKLKQNQNNDYSKKVPELIVQLNKNIEGEVRFDEGSRALYATDSSNYRQVPIGVVIPKSIEDVVSTVKICNQLEIPLLSRGGGTSVAGQCCNVAVVIDFSKYLNKVLQLDPHQKLATVQPGCILDDLRDAAENYHLTFAPDPSTHNRNTLGGMLGNNSCGRSLLSMYEGDGCRTSDNVHALKILTYDGFCLSVGKTNEAELESIIRRGDRKAGIYSQLKNLRDRYQHLIREKFPKIPRRVSGYNLDDLLPENGFNVARALCGTEGTCITILEATLNLVHSPSFKTLLIFGYEDIAEAGDHLLEILPFKPATLEGMDDILINYMKGKGMLAEEISLLPEGRGWLLIEMSGNTIEEADEHALTLIEHMKKQKKAPIIKVLKNPIDQKKIWSIRESGLGATAFVPGSLDTWEGWEDSAVPVNKVGEYIRKLKKLFDQYNYQASIYGHFGQGCLHCRIPFDLETRSGILTFRSFLDDATDLVVQLGGSLSGEHGDGQSRAELLPKMFGEELMDAFRQFKSIWDPKWKMNPGKVVNANPIISNLRIGTDYNPWNPVTHFNFPRDQGSFARAALRCVGVGLCRRQKGGVMCPSYQATKEERYSTRGRARLLFEMLEQKVIGKNGWHDKHVKQALDLCLSCKGCKSDCPVNVDMAKYKAEFLSHYHKYHLRHRSAYVFGYIYRWLKIMSKLPNLFNFFNQNNFFAPIIKFICGISPQRNMPVVAQQTLQDWYQEQNKKNDLFEQKNKKIILWADTFTNYLDPDAGIAALNVLKKFGFEVMISPEFLCCGRPLYDFGFLPKAKKLLRNILTSLREQIREGVNIVGLEPSCVATFRDEMLDLFPEDIDAKRLSHQIYTLDEFIDLYVPENMLPKINRKALIQPHCHHHAVIKMNSEKNVLEKLGLDFEILNAGCCGMAGGFGYEKGEHYEVSMKIAENALLPAVRSADEDTLIIADGFSCRSQINQCTSRKALHLAEVIQMGFEKS